MVLALPAILKPFLPSFLKGPLHTVRRQLWRFWPPRHMFVFGGRTRYWPGFGRDLYATQPVFQATVQECERTLLALGGKSMLAHFEGPLDPLFPADEEQLQQFVTVVQLALADLWRAQGVQPDAVMGMSSGEIGAVYAAGGLTLTDSLRVSMCAALISTVELPVYGALNVVANHERVCELCAGCPVELFLLQELEPTSYILFCALTEMDAAKNYLRAQGASFYQIKTAPNWPYHTPLLSRHNALLLRILQDLAPLYTTKPCYLATLGQLVPANTQLPQEYWFRVLQEPVYQYSTIRAAILDGYHIMISMGPPPFSYFSRSAQKRTLSKVRLLVPFKAEVPELESLTAARQQLKDLGLVPGRRAGLVTRIWPVTKKARPLASAANTPGQPLAPGATNN